ncbi:hypothetical protein FRC02_002935 [Tulasnella sp. 418]|nr:hypothetical protein FRC02_002935 [Tulasnella sp. 418]
MEVDVPRLAYVGQACFKCYARSAEKKLMRCSKCKRVHYCSVDCQKADYKNHKEICRALATLLGDSSVPTPSYQTSTREELERHAMKLSYATISHMGPLLRRNLTTIEQNLVAWEPRCVLCYKREVDLNPDPKSSSKSSLTPCHCLLSFYCSEAHANESKESHTVEILENGLSQCDLNTQCNRDQYFQLDARKDMGQSDSNPPSTPFVWAPERIKDQYESLLKYEPLVGVMKSIDDISPQWRKWFEDSGCPFTHVPTVMRLATKSLTIPLTTLYGFDVLYSKPEFGPKLVIHYIGTADFEVLSGGPAHEEIAHSIPTTKTLDLHFIGPELQAITKSMKSSKVVDMEACPTCQQAGKTRIHTFHAYKYHDWVHSLGDQYTKPDIAVIFNSGIHEEESSFAPTIRLLVEQGIPTIITSYNELEVRQDLAAVQNSVKGESGVNIVMEPKRNPWKCELGHSEPCGQRGYYFINGWTFAFSGRKVG